jgi:hypothetical protein
MSHKTGAIAWFGASETRHANKRTVTASAPQHSLELLVVQLG